MPDTLLFTAGVTLPVCIMLLAGILLKKTGYIDDHFISVSSRLVFNFGLPAVLFFSLSSLDHSQPFDTDLLLFTCIATVTGFFLAWLLSLKVVPVWQDRGVFIQGAARGNLAVVGLALAGNMYGEEGIALLSLLMVVTIPVYNILSIVLLAYYGQDRSQQVSPLKLFQDIVSNPLIIAVLAGVLFSTTGLEIPAVIDKVGHYFARITLPLALLGVGGTLSLKALGKTSHVSFWASLAKVALLPLIVVPVAMLLGYEAMELGVLFLMMSCPTAAASFIMAKASGGNGELAANIIVLTTLASLPAVSLGLFVMKTWGVI
ncbi:AEC family transporter [Endozoicomonas lisbonensis]|uniref:Permease n=1 Tax=Endozoicomonas lisbonensis TaxID=3120522 RepID=A0ABV2SJT4_9GAMM